MKHKFLPILILIILVVVLVTPLVHQVGEIIGISASPLIVAVGLLLLAWALS